MREMTDLPPGVIGFETAGWIRSGDLQHVVRPAVEKAAAAGDLRCVLVVDELGGITPAALWHDLTVGFQHLRTWKRIALVTDVWWICHMAAMLSWATPGELKRFSRADRADAIAWAADAPPAAGDVEAPVTPEEADAPATAGETSG